MLNSKIINWYEFNKRDLPWRNTSDPYKIWISEIMLQQTQVVTVVDYYLRFINSFPSISALASANEQEVLNHWQGLGYYSRARNLHSAAKSIKDNYKGVFPDSFDEIIKLKGIGVYTASAISAFAFHLPYAAVDGNVYRVLSRLFGVSESTSSPKGKKEFQALADELMADAPPHIYNQAIIEFGALQCTAKNPDCEVCPLQAQCFAYINKQQDVLPAKKKKVKVIDRFFYYLYIYNDTRFLLQQRGERDIWRNLFEFPLIEADNKIELVDLINSEAWETLLKDIKVEVTERKITKTHKLSHQNLHIEFVHVRIENYEFEKFKSLISVDKEVAMNYPMPKPIEMYLAGK
ncbi:A/G-specific adenine glycosylase [Ancylomarina euxinus]|uniref:Adenine DNA glycosylase n=1 Tax=Ancylomarina euxinus TaxID=2283627 RepID=A0A425Y3N1_9BACT|nr:A/G-specific adenine glycosylase [Ancylomarina euxinus]MCZ4693084.1 A/G-specific adenine glycosylase [Ancylomarina euxinus]MUP15221.1 A/G-specific adenine glycosylase [Ancylomarina euxinus]RRG22649.1 A/G-specific adenine glycosylase [Ancylomarina euxinus]